MSADHPSLTGVATDRGATAAAVGDRAWLAAMLDVEAALARAAATVGLIPTAHAEAITAAARPEAFDIAALAVAAADAGNPVVPLVAELVGVVAGSAPDGTAPDGAAADVHRGATSQDVLDTAAMLVVRRASVPLLADLDRAADLTADLAARHRDLPVAGRTLGQQAAPTTFGLTAAGWMLGLDDAATALRDVVARLDVQFGGAVGTQAAAAGHGPALLDALAGELDLGAPPLAWHTERGRIVAIAGACARGAAAVSSVATDIVLLATTEVGEVSERAPGRGGSSTLPHKRNPVAAVCARAAAAQVPGLVTTLLHAAGGHEHQRAAGAWHAEWRPLTELVRTTGSAVAWLADSLEHLHVHPDRARENLERTGGLLLAEAVTTALTPRLGRTRAHQLVTDAATRAIESGRALRDVLAETLDGVPSPDTDPVLSPDPDTDTDTDALLAVLLDPARYLGSAGELVDRALAHRADRAQPAHPDHSRRSGEDP